jgi:hypothetical protein
MPRLLPPWLLLGPLLASPASAEFVNENLLTPTAPGYHVGFQNKKDSGQITEWVPEGQTVDNWTEILTVQIFNNMKMTPDSFMHAMEKQWDGGCPGAGNAEPIASGDENGYPYQVWLLNCPKNPLTGKPEITWFKALQGKDSFYLVQKAFKFAPSKEQIARWIGYLEAVRVCDSRLADRACPKTGE